jgi:hypothetical protein
MQALILTESSKDNSQLFKLPAKNLISIPIPIPISRTESNDLELNLLDQYSLKTNIFDPSKMSPPNNWRCRLEQRIQEHEYKPQTTHQIGFIIKDNE